LAGTASRATAIAGVLIVVGACAAARQPAASAQPDATAMAQLGLFSPGYLARGSVPDSMLITPPPPAPGSAALARDEEAARAALALQGTPRFAQAAIDAALATPENVGVLTCAAGFTVGPQTTPKLTVLLRKTATDLGFSVYPTKTHYKRPRPFMVNKQPTCTPQMEPMLARDGSYPSGHSAIGHGWGLIMAELVPDRAGQLVARGRAFGDSRRVCNVHWQSDVEEGGAVAAAVVARLHADAAFRADLDAARAEVAGLSPDLPKPDCTRENAALVTGV
jgi:acid phosphatase (class A)